MNVFTLIATFFSNLFKGAGQVAEATEKRDELLNAPDQQANAAAKTEEQLKADATKAVADQNLDQLRKNLSE